MDKLAVVLHATHGADDPLKLVEWDGNHGAVVVDFDFPDIPHLMIGALRQRANNVVGRDFIRTANINGDMPISPVGIPPFPFSLYDSTMAFTIPPNRAYSRTATSILGSVSTGEERARHGNPPGRAEGRGM